MAATVGYDGLEVMVWTDRVSQDAGALLGLADHYGMPVLSVHAPCLLVTQRVWSSDPWERLSKAAELADTLGAPTVVVHPPFSWQRDYARNFAAGLAKEQERHPGLNFAIENMFPVKMAGRWFVPYTPGWDPTDTGFDAYTLDLSHCAASRTDALAMAERMGAGLKHVHLGDGTGEGRDEHLVPGRGNQPCAELLRSLAARGFTGSVALEVSTRRAPSRAAGGRPARVARVRPAPPGPGAIASLRSRAPEVRRAHAGQAGVRLAARLRARCAATCERVAQRSEQKRRQLLDDVSR
jgi:sugar phosphate isomerase/epimerase